MPRVRLAQCGAGVFGGERAFGLAWIVGLRWRRRLRAERLHLSHVTRTQVWVPLSDLDGRRVSGQPGLTASGFRVAPCVAAGRAEMSRTGVG